MKIVAIHHISRTIMELQMKKQTTLKTVWELYQMAVLSLSSKRSQVTEVGRWKNYIEPFIGEKTISNLTSLDLLMLRRDVEKQNLSPQTVYHCLSLLRRVMNKASEWEQCDKQLPSFKGVMPKFDNRRQRFLDNDELELLLDALKIADESNNWHDIALFAVNTGMRKSEIFNLRLNDVDFSSQIVTIMDTKSNINRSIHLNGIAFEIVSKKKQNSIMGKRIFFNSRPRKYLVKSLGNPV